MTNQINLTEELESVSQKIISTNTQIQRPLKIL